MLLANLLIGVREGLEAAMIVMILVAYLVKSNNRGFLPWVWAGVGAALATTTAAFLIIQYGTKTLTSQGQELVGGIFSLVAVGLVTWMLLWMKEASASMSSQLKSSMNKAMAIGPFAVVIVAFTSVIREGIETALLVFDSFATTDATKPFIALMCGFAIAVAIAVAMYRGALRISLSHFFKATGVLLVIVAAGILRYGITDLQEAGVLPGLQNIAFDISNVLVPGSALATLLEGMFNFVPAPTVASIVAWLIYLVGAMWFFLSPSKKRTVEAKSPTGAAAVPEPAMPRS